MAETTATLRIGPIRLTVRAELVISPDSLGAFARSLYADRRQRDRIFGVDIFGEPNWDLLLDLFASETEGKSVSVSSASIAASVPFTTAHRNIVKLEDQGLIVRTKSTDRRRKDLRLTDETRRKISDVLIGMLSSQLRVTTAAEG